MGLLTVLIDSGLSVHEEAFHYRCFEDVWSDAKRVFHAQPASEGMMLLVIDDRQRYYLGFKLRGHEVLSYDGYHHVGRVAAKYIRGTIHYIDRG